LKALLVLIFLVFNLFAFDKKTASLIFEKIFSAVTKQEPIEVYAKNSDYEEVIRLSALLEFSKDAKFVIVSHKSEIPNDPNRILFSTDLEILKNHKNAIGAFYWEKGRPKIVFVKDRLKRFELEIDLSFEKYLVESL
jgi:hypothetical protein